MNDSELAEVIRHAFEGDARAQSEVIERYDALVRSYAIRRMSPPLRAQVQVEDVTQEVWFELFHNANCIVPKGPRDLVRWLGKVTRWKVHDCQKYFHAARRFSSRNLSLDRDDEGGLKELLVAPGERPESRLTIRDDANHWERLFRNEPRSMQEMFSALLRGLSIADIATEMNLRREKVTSRIHRTRQRLKEFIRLGA